MQSGTPIGKLFDHGQAGHEIKVTVWERQPCTVSLGKEDAGHLMPDLRIQLPSQITANALLDVIA
jgi:hypothetical protein